jgi:hypothetical protein
MHCSPTLALIECIRPNYPGALVDDRGVLAGYGEARLAF